MVAVAETPPTPRNKSRRHIPEYTWSQLLVTNLFGFNPLSTIQIAESNIYWLPQARFLIAHPNFKLEIQKKKNCLLRSPSDLILHPPTIDTHTQTHTHPTSKAHFLTARKRSKEELSIQGATEENLEPTFLHSKFLFPWFTSEEKD